MFKFDLKKLNFFPASVGREIVGVDFNGNTLKFVHARTIANKLEIVNLLSKTIVGLPEEEVYKVVKSAFSELKTKNPEVINVIPANLVITKNIEIPSTDSKEIKEIINLQAGRHTPYAREEIIVDYIDIGIYKHSYTKILLVILARNVAKRQVEILDRAGLKLQGVFFAPEAVVWFISDLLGLANQDTPTSIMHVDENFTDFTIAFKNKVIFIRSIPIGTLHLQEESFYLKFAEETRRSLEAYHTEEIEKSPSLLVLTGAVDELGDLITVLSENLHLPVKVVSYFKSILLSAQAMKVATLTKRVCFLGVTAALLNQRKLKINLVTEEVKLRRSFEERGKELIKTGIFIISIFVLIFSILTSKIYFKSTYLKKLDTKFQSLDKDVREVEGDFAKIGVIKNYLLKRGYPLEILTQLYNILPLELQLNDIRFDEQGKFSLRGTSETMSVIFSFVENLGKSKYFRNCKTKYTTKRKEGLKDFTDFEINCQLKPEVE